MYNYYRDELSDDADNANHADIQVVNSDAFKYKTRIIGNIYNIARQIDDPENPGNLINNVNYVAVREGTKETEIAIPLKYLGNFAEI